MFVCKFNFFFSIYERWNNAFSDSDNTEKASSSQTEILKFDHV